MCESCLPGFYQGNCHRSVNDRCYDYTELFRAEESPKELNFGKDYAAYMEENFSGNSFPSFSIMS